MKVETLRAYLRRLEERREKDEPHNKKRMNKQELLRRGYQ